MSSLLKRLADVARSYIPAGDWRGSSSRSRGSSDPYDDVGDMHGPDRSDSTADTRRREPKSGYGHLPRQVVEDLAVFNLVPPSSLEAVKKARNREIKKYHSDRFLSDPVKLETSKEIMQIFNAAYDRLEAYFRK